MQKKKIRFALVGCGRIGQRHAKHITELGALTAVCDTDQTKANTFSGTYSVPAYLSLDAMLNEIKATEVIVICTPNGLHAAQSIAALHAGYHVLVEKPMAITSLDCCNMILAAEKSKKILFAIKQNRYNPPVAAVKEAIDKGFLGKIYSFHVGCYWNRGDDYYKDSWKGTKSLDGGTLFTQFSHFIDLIYWLIGDIKEATATTSNFNHKGLIEFEDTGVATLICENGAIGSLHYTVNAYNKNMEGSITIFAEKGTVKIGGQYLNTLEYQQIQGYTIPPLPQGNTPNDYGTYVGSMSNHDKVYQNVIAVLLNGKPMTTQAFEAMKTVEIIEKIYKNEEK